MESIQKVYNINKSTIFLIIAVIIFTANEALFVEFYPPILKSAISISRLLLLAYCLCKPIIPLINTKFFVALILYVSIYSVSSVINGQFAVIPILSKSLCVFLFYIIYSKHIRDNAQRTLNVFSATMLAFIVVNTIFVIFMPDGLWMQENSEDTGFPNRHFIGGNHNAFAPFYFVTLVLCILYDKNFNNGLPNRTIIAFLFSLISLFFVGSVTGILGVILLLLYVTLVYKMRIAVSLLYLIIIFFIFAQIVFVMIQDLENYPILASFVESALGKDVTFSGRTFIWKDSLDLIYQKPAIGWGYRSAEWYQEHFSVVNSHNLILSILLKGGVLLLLNYIIIVLLAFKNTTLSKHNSNTVFLAFSVVVFSIMMIMEAYNIFYVFSLFIIVYNLKHIDIQSTNQLKGKHEI